MPTFNSTKILGDLKTTGEIQNNSIWINDGTNINSYNENIRLFAPSNGATVIGFNATGTSGTPATSILGYSDRLETRVGNDWLTRHYSSNLQIASRTDVHYTASTGGGQNRFNGLYAPSVSNGRAQLVLSSSYSDLVIASSQANNNHGSTLTFASYNPSNAGEYRKFVINQGNWGNRFGYLDFGYDNNSFQNPHDIINSTDTVLTLDGVNKRVGIKNMSPSYELDIVGSIRLSGELYRTGHNNGYFVGSYNNVGDNALKTNPIYTIGSNYKPTDTTLSNMYGIGYTYSSASFITIEQGSGWGLYVASDGDARVWLNGSNGTITSTGDHYTANGKLAWVRTQGTTNQSGVNFTFNSSTGVLTISTTA